MKTDNQKYNEQVKPNTAFIEELKEKLPELVKSNGQFDTDKLLQLLNIKNKDELSQGYQLNFIGKDYARRQAGEMPSTVIVPDNEQNNGEGKDSKNLFFTGDNLEVLRHLQSAYTNKIDVIYIDPPYNTGKDGFAYRDKFLYSDEELKEMLGLSDESVQKIKALYGKSSHSAWLTFMYSRLFLAKKLLSDKGVIYVSIDDNEESNLIQIMKEIFGENNFIAQIIIDATPKNDPLLIATSHEYVLAFCKDVNVARTITDWGFVHPLNKKLNDLIRGKKPREAERELNAFFKKNGLNQDNISNYKYVDEKGIYRTGPLDDPQGKGPKDNRVNPITGNFLKIPSRGWSCNIETWNSWKKKGLIKFPEIDGKLASKKTYLNENKLEVGRSVLKIQTRKSTNYLNNLFGVKNIFKNPKPMDLLEYLLNLHQNDKEMTVLDFFAGSGTTADAVMRLNAEDCGHRKFIMVQLSEKTYEIDDNGLPKLKNGQRIPTKGAKAAFDAGFRSIDEISRERIKRAAKKIKEDNALTLQKDFDGSFKHYRVVKPTQQTLNDIEDFNPDATALFTNMVDSFSSQTLEVAGNASGEDTIMTTWLAKDGYSFDADIKLVDFAGYKGTVVDDNRLYLIKEGWGAENTKALLNKLGTHQLNLQTVAIFGYSFNIAELRELENGLKQLENKVELQKRY